MQRHKNDTVERLPSPHADRTSPMFVPLELRAAFSEIDDATELDLKRQLWSGEVTGPWWRTIAGRNVVISPKDSDEDFEVGLCWLKVAEAGRRVARDNERRSSAERNQRHHTCGLCGRYDKTANTGNGVTADVWCELFRDELRRQQVAEHAAHKVNGSSVADLIAANRQQVTT